MTKSNLVYNSAIMNTASIVEKICFFIMNLIIARYLSLEHYGEYATALGYVTFFSVFTNLGMSESLIRLVKLQPAKEAVHLGSSIVIKSALSMIVFMVILGSIYLSSYKIEVIRLTLILGLVRIGSEYMLTFYSFFNAKEQFNYIAWTVITFSLSLLGSTALIIALKYDYFAIVSTRLIVVIVFTVFLFLVIIKYYKIQIERESIRGFIVSTVPFSAISIFDNVIQRFNMVILPVIINTDAAGIFYNGYIIVNSLFFITVNLDKVLLPVLYDVFKDNNINKFQLLFDKISKITLLMSIYIVFIFFHYGDYLILSLFGEKFAGSADVLKITSFSLIFLFSPVTQIITSSENQKIRAKLYFISMLINLSLCYYLGARFGVNGIAFAVTFTYFFYFISVLLVLAVKKIIRTGYLMTTLLRGLAVVAAVHFLVLYVKTWGLCEIIQGITTSLFFMVFTMLLYIDVSDYKTLFRYLKKITH